MVQPNLQAIVLLDNPWLEDRGALADWYSRRVPGSFIPRHALRDARRRWSGDDRAHLVIGPRQAGKSTAIWAHLQQRGEPALFVDCEQPQVQQWCRSAPLFLTDLKDLLSEPVTLFFDEVQHLEEAGLFFKGLVDRRIGVPILVTGSSSYHLGARTRESLAGRATRARLLPFSLAEVSGDATGLPEALARRRRLEHFERHLRIGGYPAVWLSDEPELLLAELVESIILRDASDLHNINRPDAFRRMLRLLAGQTGSLVNLSEWSSVLGISRETVASYLSILEDGHVAVSLPPWTGGRRSEITSRPKIFLVDNGIRHRLLNDFKTLGERTDTGAALESWVFTELWKVIPMDTTLHFWRSSSGAEVDFVASRGDRLVAVEVKASRLERPKLPRAARSFIDAYEPRSLFIVNTGLEHRDTLASTRLRWLHPVELAAAVAAELAD